jgi:dipeptidyl-peptidase-4
MANLKHGSGVTGYLATLALLLAGTLASPAQDRLKTMPGHERYEKMSREIPGSVKLGTLTVSWKDEGKAFEFRKDGKAYRYDIAEKKLSETGPAAAAGPIGPGGRFGGRGTPFPPGASRGRAAPEARSPDGKHKAFYRDRNLWLSDVDGKNEVQISKDGDEKKRVRVGTAPWVYAEELFQRTAMWWSPDNRKVAFYRFDESQIPDYYLALGQTAIQSKLDVEPYPKAGAPNPIVDLLIYDMETKQSVQVDVRDGKPFTNESIGHYVYNVGWSPDGKELHFFRTNRRQNVMEFAAADPVSGKTRVIVREEWLPSWVENLPRLRFLKDNQRFIWPSERTGWRNFYLYHVSGELQATLTSHGFEVANIVKVDEAASQLWYMARSGDNPMKQQLHRVGLDGKGDVRLTDPAFHHQVELAPDGRHFIDVAQTHNQPPTTRLIDAEGKLVAELAKSDTSKFEQLGLQRAEVFTFKAADGKTDLYGVLHRPSNFDPAKKYPLLVSVYAGPATNGASEVFSMPSALTEYGFLVARLDSRSAAGRGKKFLDSIYLKLGQVEVDDQAAGVKALGERPYVDRQRVGIHGTSYGGTTSALCLLRYPELFHAAVANSSVTDFRNYDSIYTERYMWLPQENKEGYDAGSAMTYADKLKGRLMLYYGTADNNVHPSNTLQLIRALQRAGKSFEVQIGPDAGHTAVSQPRMMEFFIENLVLPGREAKASE